jgi:hypothetical protein
MNTLTKNIEFTSRPTIWTSDVQVALDRHGKTQFKDLLFRRGEPRFYAFDLLWYHGEDLSLTAVISLPFGH